jgi:glycosyltransferase involved in cell wall biosynthesis
MVPVYNRTRYLNDALDSVVAQAIDRSKMQIEVVDDCSTENDVMSLINRSYGDRISFYRQPKRVGMAENWNTCIQRARGTLVHILHDDDFVAPGYYAEIETLARKYPNVGLYATRNFWVDDESIITGISARIRELEKPAKTVDSFLYQTPIQCAAVTIRRAVFEVLGRFRLDMGYVIDREMWARVTSSQGAIVSPKILASYRLGSDTDSHRVLRTAQSIRDICRLNELFAQRYPSFCKDRGRATVSAMAWEQYLKFKRMGDDVGAAANYEAWVQFTPIGQRVARHLEQRVARYSDSRIMAHVRRARQLGLLGTVSRISAKLSSRCSWQQSPNRR